MKRNRSKSKLHINAWFLLYFFVSTLVMVLLGTVISSYAMHVIRTETYRSVTVALNEQNTQLSNRLHSTELYLARFTTSQNTDVEGLSEPQWGDFDWLEKAHNLQSEFSTALSSQFADNFIYYSPDSNLFLSSPAVIAPELRSKLEDTEVLDSYFESDRAGKWGILQAGSRYYLVRFLRIDGGYIGAYISVDSALSLFSQERSIQYIDLALSNGKLLRTNPIVSELDSMETINESSYNLASINGEDTLILSEPLSDAYEIHLIEMVPDRALASSALIFSRTAIMVFAITALLLSAFMMISKHFVVEPTRTITQTMAQIRDGKIKARITTSFHVAEFNEMGKTFNEMMDEIEQLQISVYEEKLRQQDAEIEYYKLQMTPHFLVNCLNSVYQLTENGQQQLSLDMTMGLTKHLRYLLDSPKTVPLATELKAAENYVDLSLIRYPGSIRLDVIHSPEADQRSVVPLLILNFVENTVKYEVQMGELTVIRVEAEINEDNALHICISDNGQGYSAEMLKELSDMDHFSHEKNGHIGIGNVYLRARLLLDDHCEFRFRNRDEGGALTDITIPFREVEGK